MKKTIVVFSLSLLTLGGVFTSCSGNDDDKKTEEQVPAKKYDVVGYWQMKEFKQNGNWVNISNLNYYIDLKADGTYETNYLGANDSGTYTYDNNDIVETQSPTYDPLTVEIVMMTDTDAHVKVYESDNPSAVREIKLVR